MLAITDHDTVAAYRDLPVQAAGPVLIPGIEFSTCWAAVNVHVLGLNIQPEHPAIGEGVALQSAARQQRARQIGENLGRQGIAGAFGGARRLADGDFIGRPHFARHLVATGVVDDIETAFKKYLGAGKAGDVRQHWAEMPDIIEWIRAAGGIAVLAHPLKYKLTRTRLKRLLDAFSAAGGEAMEVVSGQQSAFQTRDLGQLCAERKLLASCGSDFHQPGLRWSELGRFEALPRGVTPVWEHF